MRNLILDGKNVAYRCFVGGNFTTRNGDHVEVPYIFLRILSKILREQGPIDRVIVCWDGGRSPMRLDYYPAYKQSATETIPSDLEETAKQIAEQFEKLKTVLQILGVRVLKYDSVEADDLIAYTAKWFKFDENLIVSADKDYLHLVSPNVAVYDGREKLTTVSNFASLHHGLTPKGFLFAHAILGDGSDNIPGVFGVGWGTLDELAGLLNAADTLEEFFHELSEFTKKSKRIETLLSESAVVLRNLFLIDLRYPRLTPEAYEDLPRKLVAPVTIDEDRVVQFLKDQDMKSLLSKFNFWFKSFTRLV